MSDEYVKDFDGWFPLKKKIQEDCNVPTFRQRDIWWCSTGINLGVEQDGKNDLYERPVLIVRKFNNRQFMGVPLTSQIKDFPLRHSIFYKKYKNQPAQESQALLTQMRSFDAMRLTRDIARLGPSQFNTVMDEIRNMLGNAQ